MNCPNCQTANPENARYCFNCGQRLEAPSHPERPAAVESPGGPASGTPGRAGSAALAGPPRLDRFIPPELMRKLEAARSGGGISGERRVVTMLFCDIKDSTAAASRLDPEEWAEIVNAVFAEMIRPVYAYEGTVARLMGDGLLAFFGAPIAHEDDPQRAVLAGLDIVAAVHSRQGEMAKRWGIDLDVRVGINTGLVVVGGVGSDLRMEYTAVGDAINLAARMEQTARPGSVQAAEATWKLVAPLFEAEVLEAVQVKGRPEPVRAYRILGEKARPGSLRGIAGLDAPLAGRQRELETLQAALRELIEGRGRILSVIGEAGLGKSRLVAELRKLAPDGLMWVEGRSLSYETATPFAPFAGVFSGLLDLEQRPANSPAYAEIKRRIEARLPGRAGELAPFIASLLGLKPEGEDLEQVKYLEPPFLRGRIFAAAGAFLTGLAASRPLAIVLDDIHWIDPTSLELLKSLLPLVEEHALLIIAEFRPRREELSWQFHELAAGEHAACYTALFLEALDQAAAGELFSNLLHIDDLPERIRGLILERAEGNPFFIEELIRTLLDAGLVVNDGGRWRAVQEVEELTLPGTLNGVISARLDRLDENARQVAQTAAVIGRDFGYEVLARMVDRPDQLEAGLAQLRQRELVRDKPEPTRRAYLFKHVLTQEAAYNSVLLSRRRDLHRRAAEALQDYRPDEAGEIARHFLKARLPAQAAPYLVRAGDQAAHAYATAEAVEHYSKALELREAIPDPALVRRAYEGLGSALAFGNRIPEAVENYRAMLALAEQNADTPMQISALTHLASVLALRMGQFQEADGLLLAADRMARAYDGKTGIPEMAILRCQMCTAMADFDSVVKHMGEVVALGPKLEVKEYQSMAMEHVAGSLMFLTRFDEALERAEEGLAVARQIGDREHEAALLTQSIPMSLAVHGKLDEARRAAEQGLEIAGRIGSIISLVYGNWLVGEIARWRGEYETALLYGSRSLEAALPVEEHMPFITVQPLGSLGTTYLEISGHFSEKVARFHRHALQLLENPSGQAGGGTAWADLGFCALTVGDLEAAEASFQKGLNHPSMFMLVERPRHLIGMALIALRRGQPELATHFLAEAQAYVTKREMKHLEPLIALTAGQIRAASGERELALVAFERAEVLGLQMNLRPIVWQARAAAAGRLAASGRTAEAEAQRRAARAVIEEIAGLFADPTLREAFLRHTLPRVAEQGPTGFSKASRAEEP